MKENISRISVGIRHRRSFRLPEIAGSIIDYIVQDKNSPFGESFFQSTDTLLDGLENKGRILYGTDGKSSIAIDIDSFIINLTADDFEGTLSEFKERIIPYTKAIFKKFEIENINRVGIVFEFENTGEERVKKLISKSTNNIFSHVDRLDLRFSEKDPDIHSLVKKEILDYANSIVILSKGEEKTVLRFDYQFYYSPEIKNIDDIDFEQFISTATSKLESKFTSWILQDAEKE